MATDIHIILIPSPSGTVPTPLPHPFVGIIDGNLSQDVNIMGMAAATVDSTATNTPQINGKMAARNGDTAMTCNNPSDLPGGTVMAVGTVLIG